ASFRSCGLALATRSLHPPTGVSCELGYLSDSRFFHKQSSTEWARQICMFSRALGVVLLVVARVAHKDTYTFLSLFLWSVRLSLNLDQERMHTQSSCCWMGCFIQHNAKATSV
ncbi:hypothetical protein SPRG_19595, partial [Saprolegnia parasitica CBS 223.65]